MNKYKLSSNSQACGEQGASKAQNQPQYAQLKLALDVHAASIVVVRMLDGAKPQPPQTFNSGWAYDCSDFPRPSRRALARARAAAHKS